MVVMTVTDDGRRSLIIVTIDGDQSRLKIADWHRRSWMITDDDDDETNDDGHGSPPHAYSDRSYPISWKACYLPRLLDPVGSVREGVF